MLNEILFWKNWNPLFKTLYFFLLFIFIVALSFFVYGYLRTEESILPWQTINYIDKKPFPYLEITRGIFTIPLENYTFFVTQNFRASSLLVNFDAVNIFSIVLLTVLVFLFSVISYFKSWWFYLANTLIIATIAGLRLDLFMVFGDVRNVFVLFVMVTSVGLNAFYHFYKPNTAFIMRLISYVLLFVIYGIIILKGSNLTNPQLYLTNYGLFAPLFIVLIFVLLVAFDVEYIFMYLATSSKSLKNTSNAINFLIICSLYLLNILLTILRRMNIIHWDLLYFDEYLLLGLATLAGFWAYRRRLEATGSVIPFQPFGAFFYLLMAGMTWACIGYLHATGNLSLIRSVRGIILFSHFGFGLGFVIYVLYNFTVYFNQNLHVYETIFAPKNSPIHFMRIGGLIITMSLIATNYNITIDYMFAGYYSNIADVYLEEKNYPMASQYYEKVSDYKPYDFKRTLGIAAIAEAYGEYDAAISEYNKLHQSFDCEQAYINEAYLYDKTDNFLKALGVLKDGLLKYPSSPRILLNIGYVFSKTKLTDSAYYYYNLAEKN